MDETTYDEAGRYLSKQARRTMGHWLIGLGAAAARIDSFLDGSLVIRGKPQRVCDQIVAFADLARNGVPCAGIVEFQIAPDPLMYARMLVGGGMVWELLKPSEEPGDRYDLMAVVVNFTGKGNMARETRIGPTSWGVVPHEINLEGRDARVVLDEIEAGTTPKEVLAFIPLMQNGGEDDTIDRWLVIVRAETDLRKRGDYALAIIFANAVGLKEKWKRRLEGLTMIEAPIVTEWKAEARAEGVLKGTIDALVRVLERRFTALPSELVARIRSSEDIAELSGWMDIASVAPSLDEFRRGTNL